MPVIHISNGIIEDIFTDRDTVFVTVTYMEGHGTGRRRNEQTVRMAVNRRTIILNSRGTPVTAEALSVGMTIDAVVSAAMTRSIPPQATAYLIVIVQTPVQENVTVGRITDVDRRNSSFTTISDRDFASVIRFNVSENTLILDRSGRPVNFSRLAPGMRVRVRYANFMTASIPPQTTAFEVRIL